MGTTTSVGSVKARMKSSSPAVSPSAKEDLVPVGLGNQWNLNR